LQQGNGGITAREKQSLPWRGLMVQLERGSTAIAFSRTNLAYKPGQLLACLLIFGMAQQPKPAGALQKPEHPTVTLQLDHAALACSITGTVRNPQGVALPGATVSIQPSSGAARTLTTDSAGHFCAAGLADGRYSVTFQKPGFRSIRLEAVTVAANHSAQADAALPMLELQSIHTPTPLPPPPPIGPSHPAGQAPEHHMHHSAPISHKVASGGADSGGANGTPAPSNSGSSDNLGEEEAKWFSQLPSGSIRYDVPPQMTIGVPSTVTVTIDGYKAPAQQPNSDGSAPSTLKVADWMRVEISQPGNPDEFTITGDPGQNPQFVPIDSGATWEWTVTPNHLGTQKKLQFQAFVLYRDDKSKVQRELPSTQKTVTVQAEGVKGIVHQEEDNFWLKPDNWFKYMLPGGAGFGALVALFGWWQKRGKKSEPGAK
jgi:hypothetical protein